MSILGDTLLSSVQKLVGSTGKSEHKASVNIKKGADSFVKTNKGADSFVKTGTDNGSASAPASYGGGYGYGGGGGRRGGGGGGGGGTSKDQQKQTQAQLNNTGGNYEKRLGDINQNVEGRKGDLDKITKDRLGDMDRTAQDQLNNIKQQQQANATSLATNRRNIMQGIDWQPNQQKEQSTLMALRNRMGNSAYGSGIQDLAEGMSRVDDMNDYQLISAWKQNENNAYANWYQAEQGLIGDYNEHVAQINDEISQFRSDYRDQMSKLRSDYNDEVSKLYSQYWSTMSNINPELATQENIDKASRNAAGTSAATKKQKAISDAVAKMTKGMTGKKQKKISTKGLDATQKAAAKIINDAIKKNSKTSAVVKAATANAKKALETAGRISVGKGNDKYYLPNADLSKRANIGKDLNIGTSSALQKMLVRQANAKSQNKNTANYVRPDHGAGDVLLGGSNGEINNSRAANRGFSDNLAAFRRV